MEFNINSDTLGSILKNVTYIVSGINEKSLLARMLIEVSNNKVVFSLSNSTDRAIIKLPCQAIQEGRVYTTASKFIALIQSLSGEISIKLVGNEISITQSHLCVKLPIISDSSGLFNGININQPFNDCGKIDGSVLAKATNITTPFVNVVNNTSPTKGVCIKANVKDIKLMSCNGAIMSFFSHPLDQSASMLHTLRVETLTAVSRIFGEEKDVSIASTPSGVKISGQNCEIYASVLQGTYPPLQKIIENGFVYSFTLDKATLEHSLKCISIVKTPSKRLEIDCCDKTINLRYESHFVEKLIDENATGDNVRIFVDYELLWSALKAADCATPTFKITLSIKLYIMGKNSLIIIAPQQ